MQSYRLEGGPLTFSGPRAIFEHAHVVVGYQFQGKHSVDYYHAMNLTPTYRPVKGDYYLIDMDAECVHVAYMV
jgi:hypothetical protein